MQKTLLKKKKKQKLESELSAKQKVALHALQKQLQLLNLREWLFTGAFIGGAALLRVPMQAFPNVEPITFFAVLAGWLFGWKKGLITGASALYVSNFLVMGGQVPWTIPQLIGFGAAGLLGGLLRKKSRVWEAVAVMAVSTLITQIVLNLSWGIMMGFNIFAIFVTGAIFTIVHVVSNAGFGLLLPFARKVAYEKGKFNEKTICTSLINRIRSGNDPNRKKSDSKNH